VSEGINNTLLDGLQDFIMGLLELGIRWAIYFVQKTTLLTFCGSTTPYDQV